MRAVLAYGSFCFRAAVLRWAAVAVVCAGGWLLPGAARAASDLEGQAFTNALKSFQGQVWELADKDFGLFFGNFPESPLRPQAVLLQAQARIQARRPAAAVELLLTNLPQAGPLADEYYFWLGEAHLTGSNYLAAAGEFARLAREFPASPRGHEAIFGEALARSRLGDWPAVVALLGTPEGSFRQFVQSNATQRVAVDGLLLLAEAQVQTRHPTDVAATLAPLAGQTLPPRLAWQRRYLLTRADLDVGRIGPALVGASNLLAVAEGAGLTDLTATSRELTADLLAEVGQSGEAVRVLEASLATNAPAAARRPALFRVVRLLLGAGQVEEAERRLNEFLKVKPEDGTSPVFLVALGELKLRQHLAGHSLTNAPETNRLESAVRLFDAALTNTPPGSPLRGQLELLRGWSFWLAGRTNDSRTAFAAAVATLPFSTAQAVARFKLADTELLLGEAAKAMTNYARVAGDYAALPTVSGRLRELALYQLLRASLEVNDRAVAAQTLDQLLALPAAAAGAQGGLLLLGESQLAEGSPRSARALFAEFARRFPDSPKRPEAELGLARAAEREGRWEEARAVYGAWVTNWPAHPALPLAEYALAQAIAQAGPDTNVFARFTNFVARFPTNELAAFAQNWIADFHFRQGDFKAAEEGYQILFQKWPASELAGEAQMMAGRAAAARLEAADAQRYFTGIINASNSPPPLVARALFALGDTATRAESTDTNKPLGNFVEAINAFRKLQQLYPTNELTLLAEGRIGDCYLQLAGADAQYYETARAAYSNVLASATARVTARSQAEVGLGLVLDKQARLLPAGEPAAARQAALERFLNVAYERNLRDGERADAFWVKRAALEGARLAEELQLWPAAASLYEHLGRLLPALKPGLEPKLQKAREQLPR